MEKKLTLFALLIAIFALFSITIINKKKTETVLKKILHQQNIIIKTQHKMKDDMRLVVSLQSQGQERLDAIENQWKNLQNVLQQQPKRQAPSAPPSEDFTKAYVIPIAHSPLLGNKEAPVTIVEFVDFQCPYCSRFHTPLVEIIKAYPDKVNYMIKNFPLPFHSQAKPAAKAAFSAGEQGKYKEMADALLKNSNNLSKDKYTELAQNLGLNMDQFLKDIKEKNALWEEYIQKDIQLGRKINVLGTPTFYINGRKTKARDVEAFKKEIDNILKIKE